MAGSTRPACSNRALHPGYKHLDPEADDDHPPKKRRTKAEMEAARRQEAEMKAAQELVRIGKIQTLADVQERLRAKDRLEQSSTAALALPARLRRAAAVSAVSKYTADIRAPLSGQPEEAGNDYSGSKCSGHIVRCFIPTDSFHTFR